jgi:hypothetical protein
MDFSFSKEEEIFRHSVREFCEKTRLYHAIDFYSE